MSGADSVVRTMDRTKQRSTVAMTDDEVKELLDSTTRSMAIATINPDGSVHLVAMSFAILDGQPVMSTKAKSQKIANILRHDRVSCLVEEGVDYEDLRGVSLVGRAEILTGYDDVFAVVAEMLRRHTGFELTDDTRPTVERVMTNRVAIRITPQKFVTWDHRKLATQTSVDGP